MSSVVTKESPVVNDAGEPSEVGQFPDLVGEQKKTGRTCKRSFYTDKFEDHSEPFTLDARRNCVKEA